MRFWAMFVLLAMPAFTEDTKHEGNFRIRRRVFAPMGNRDPFTGVNRPANMFLPGEMPMRRENVRFAPPRRRPVPPAPQPRRSRIEPPSRRGPPAIRPPKGVARKLNQASDFRRLAFQLLRGRFTQ